MGAGLARYGRTCPKCGTGWQSTRSDAVYCSGKCRMRALREAVATHMIPRNVEPERPHADVIAREVAAKAATDAKAAAKVAAVKAQKKNGKPKKKAKVAARRTTVTKKAAKGRAR